MCHFRSHILTDRRNRTDGSITGHVMEVGNFSSANKPILVAILCFNDTNNPTHKKDSKIYSYSSYCGPLAYNSCTQDNWNTLTKNFKKTSLNSLS